MRIELIDRAALAEKVRREHFGVGYARTLEDVGWDDAINRVLVLIAEAPISDGFSPRPTSSGLVVGETAMEALSRRVRYAAANPLRDLKRRFDDREEA
jgi:hypothetical protein